MHFILSIQSSFSNSSSSSRKFLRKQLLSRGFHVEKGFFCEYHWISTKSLRTKLFQRSNDFVSYFFYCLNTKIKRDCNSIQTFWVSKSFCDYAYMSRKLISYLESIVHIISTISSLEEIWSNRSYQWIQLIE